MVRLIFFLIIKLNFKFVYVYTQDLNLSDTIFNDLFSEFDVNTNDFRCFNDSTNNINYSQSISDLSLSYNNALNSTTTNNNTQNLETVSYEVFSPNSFKSLIEQ
jgi:hypothetical protein